MSPRPRRLLGPGLAAAAVGLLALSWGLGLHLVLGDLVVPFWMFAGLLAVLGLFAADLFSAGRRRPVGTFVVLAVVVLGALGSLGVMLLREHSYAVTEDSVMRTGTTGLDDYQADRYTTWGPFAAHDSGWTCDKGAVTDAAECGTGRWWTFFGEH